jgi:dihydrofolate reductase
VAEQPDSFFHDFDEVMRANLQRVVRDQDAVLLGRTSYEDWARFWPGSDLEPFAPFINGVRKYVVTSSALTTPWQNSVVVDAPLKDFVSELKAQEGGDIGVHASLSVAHTLLSDGLVDELRLVVAPATASGRKLLDDLGPRRFQLTRNVSSPAGYLLLDYQVCP